MNESAVIDLAKTPDQADLSNGELDITTVEKFLATGEYKHCKGKYPILCNEQNNDLFTVVDDWLYCIGSKHNRAALAGKIKPVYVPDGFLLPGIKGNKWMLARNGDISEEAELLEFEDENLFGPTFSFQCLGRFLIKTNNADKLRNATINAIKNKTIHFVDFYPDQTIPCKPGEKSSPAPCFTRCIDRKWHRPSTVLIWNPANKKSIILGQDEGEYFGCELNGKQKSVDAALLALAPTEARQGQTLKPGVLRQGEWFLIPVPLEDIPAETDCAATADEILLPLDHPDGNEHSVTGHLRIGKNGRVYGKCINVEHQDHKTVSTRGGQWYFFARNTALRSFSQQNVD